MGRFLLIFSITVFLFSCSNVENTAIVKVEDLNADKPAIILMHPTVRNIETFLFLTQGGLFPIPRNMEVIGVYHSKGAYDYSKSAEFISDRQLTKIRLLEITDDLEPQNLYKQNGCTPDFEAIFKNSVGAIFFGGPDIPPACYNEPTSLLTVISDTHRHYLELSLLFHLLGGSQDTLFVPMLNKNTNYAILGICLGMQSINVATGGTMIQDIPTEIYGLKTLEDVFDLDKNYQHRNYYTHYGVDDNLIWGNFHQIKFEEGSLFDSLNSNGNQYPFVLSSHHQALGRLGRGVVPIAWSMDGKITEAIKHAEFPNVIGVQFHPEVPSLFKPEVKLTLYPSQKETSSYPEMFGKEGGLLFHQAFWQHIGTLYK
jgi:putative glutamine amidotransferase